MLPEVEGHEARREFSMNKSTLKCLRIWNFKSMSDSYRGKTPFKN